MFRLPEHAGVSGLDRFDVLRQERFFEARDELLVTHLIGDRHAQLALFDAGGAECRGAFDYAKTVYVTAVETFVEVGVGRARAIRGRAADRR